VSEVTNEYPELVNAVDALAVSSEYFEVQVRAQVGETRVELASVVQRNPTDGTLTLIMRDFGKDFRSMFEADAPETSEVEEG
jgi:type II secretory pathway component PulK